MKLTFLIRNLINTGFFKEGMTINDIAPYVLVCLEEKEYDLAVRIFYKTFPNTHDDLITIAIKYISDNACLYNKDLK